MLVSSGRRGEDHDRTGIEQLLADRRGQRRVALHVADEDLDGRPRIPPAALMFSASHCTPPGESYGASGPVTAAA